MNDKEGIADRSAGEGWVTTEVAVERTDTGTRAVRYDHTDEVSTAVPTLVGACEGTDPCSLPPLYGAVDPDALDALVAGGRAGESGVAVTFRYAGYRVDVGGGVVSVQTDD